MAAVQIDNGVEVVLAVSAPRSRRPTVATVLRRRMYRVHNIWRRQAVADILPVAEPEDHWDEGARASLAMVGVTYRADD
jgi:hypothetical protein